MQNKPQIYCEVIYDPQELPGSFPITYPGSCFHSPPTGPVSYMHYHSCLEIGYCYKGCGIFFVDGKVLPFSSGDSSIIFQNQIHIAQSYSKHPSEWKFVSLDPFRLLSDFGLTDLEMLTRILEKIRNSKNIFEKDYASEISKLIYEIIMELEDRKENYTIMVKSLLYQLLLKLCREYSETIENGSFKSFHSIIKISPSLKYISDNYANQFSIRTLAKFCRMSMTNFRRIFKSAMGMSPSEYLHLVRVKMASMLLLNTNDSILEISLKVGYPTLSSFNRQFGCIMGVPPREWRKKSYKKETDM